MTKALENKIDSLQLNIHWPNTISNVKLHEITKVTPWSARRLKWFVHLCRLPDQTPAKLALSEIQIPTKKPKENQKQRGSK